MTNSNIEIAELTMDQLDKVSAGDHAPGTRTGGGGGKGTGPGTGGGNGHGGLYCLKMPLRLILAARRGRLSWRPLFIER